MGGEYGMSGSDSEASGSLDFVERLVEDLKTALL